jgi:hypothetical protein
MQRDEALERLSEIAREQGGYVATRQAKRMGVTAEDLGRLAKMSHLRRVRRGVYALHGAYPSPHEETIAAWLRLIGDYLPWDDREPDAVASHATAASIYRVGTFQSDAPSFTVRRRRFRPTDDSLRIYEARLDPADWRREPLPEGLDMPVTTPERTVVDLAFIGEERDHVLDALAEFRHRGLIADLKLADAIRRRRALRGRGSVAWLADVVQT